MAHDHLGFPYRARETQLLVPLFLSPRWKRKSWDTKNPWFIMIVLYIVISTYVNTYVSMYVCMYACMYVCMSVCLSVCMYECMYVCICVCGCIDYQWLFIGLLYEANYIFYPFAISHIHIQNSAHQGSLSLLLSLVAYVCCNDWCQAHGWDVLSDHWQKSAPNKPFLQVHGTKKKVLTTNRRNHTGFTICIANFSCKKVRFISVRAQPNSHWLDWWDTYKAKHIL
jgi:hypothetical protein